jgi:hypothetical protein
MDFTTFRKIFFKDKQNYKYVADKEKEGVFFILNRHMARVKPANADALNHKGIETALATDIWFKFCEQSLDVPDWFYSKTYIPKKTAGIRTNAENLDDMDKIILQKFFENEIKEDKERELLAKKNEEIVVKKFKKKKGV